MDQIKIKDLEVYANHGVLKEETVLGQKFLISAILYVSTRQVGLEDNLTKSIHYGEVCHRITKFMKEHTFQLIEAAAEHLAEALLWEWPLLEAITLTLKKPWAPVGLPLDTVSIEITRRKHTAYVAMGSNLGDKEGFIQTGIHRLNNNPSIAVKQVSDLIVTKPYGGVEQDDFVNGAVKLETTLLPMELLEVLLEIESEAGRERVIHWGPRTLDLDLLFYDDEIMDEDTLVIPHPEISKRVFVLQPMVQLAPNKRHPILKKRMIELLSELEKRG